MPSTTRDNPSAAIDSGAVSGNARVPATAMNSVPPSAPPSAPSTVFFGLIAGASGRRPKSRPA
jgi:hypothetical protein